ncbi:hypothetical protein [Chryseobacterium sp. CCH4-E10]|uniref:hypothetical protein n=1 Tax=Chryseobacterium sp. CCH4-E10 TaxID=1768758 RepID=UPI0008362F17|nr:hypothetical protein [Chryseobacterium sp. CCH4-E10]
MIKNLFILFSVISLSACKSDNFYDTTRELKTDKDIYKVGDEIRITMKIIPQKDKKDIRVYENYKNIDFSFSLVNDSKNIYNGYWSATSGKHLPLSKIKKLTITKENPLNVEFVGKIYVEKEFVSILFPRINNYKVRFKKELVEDSNTIIRIHGISNPISPELGAPVEEYFNTKDFRIKL